MNTHKLTAGYDCKIRFQNHIDDCWNEWFEGLAIQHLPDGEVLVSGYVPDPAALFGLLNKVRDLNLKVVSLTVKARKEVENSH
jgi:hypothetical protein